MMNELNIVGFTKDEPTINGHYYVFTRCNGGKWNSDIEHWSVNEQSRHCRMENRHGRSWDDVVNANGYVGFEVYRSVRPIEFPDPPSV